MPSFQHGEYQVGGHELNFLPFQALEKIFEVFLTVLANFFCTLSSIRFFVLVLYSVLLPDA